MTALQVYALLFNGTGVIYIVNDASVLGDTTKVPSFDKGFANIDDYRGRVAKACAYNAQLLGDRALRIYLDPRPQGVGPGNSKEDVLDIAPTKAVDITDVITVKGLQEPPETITTVVSANEVTFQRMYLSTFAETETGFDAGVVPVIVAKVAIDVHSSAFASSFCIEVSISTVKFPPPVRL
jgi:hypothetical protein